MGCFDGHVEWWSQADYAFNLKPVPGRLWCNLDSGKRTLSKSAPRRASERAGPVSADECKPVPQSNPPRSSGLFLSWRVWHRRPVQAEARLRMPSDRQRIRRPCASTSNTRTRTSWPRLHHIAGGRGTTILGQFRNVHQSLKARFQFNERPEFRDARHFAIDD